MTRDAGMRDSATTVLTAGARLDQAPAAVILLHGRGGTPDDMLELASGFARPDLAYLAPAAARRAWYPHPFLVPLERNEPALSASLGMIERLVARVGTAGFTPDRVVLLGFSQGACLVLEFAARQARRYGAVVGLSGALIGPAASPRDYGGSLAGTPVFLGCSDADPHIPLARFQEAGRVLGSLGARVEACVYPGMGHTVNADEVRRIRDLLSEVAVSA